MAAARGARGPWRQQQQQQITFEALNLTYWSFVNAEATQKLNY
jgi:hypothetical protein